MAGGVNEAREEDGVYEGQKGTLEAGKRLDLLEVIGRIVARLYLPIFFFSFNNYISSASSVPGRVIGAEIRARKSDKKILVPSWR